MKKSYEMSTVEYVLTNMVKPTSNIADLKSTAYALRLARQEGIYPEILAAAMHKRAEWLTWHTMTQRKWQSKTRRVSRARHHDSISIRESSVRCSR